MITIDGTIAFVPKMNLEKLATVQRVSKNYKNNFHVDSFQEVGDKTNKENI